MKKTIKKQWIEALQSGKYRQGMGRLYYRQDNSYCCLGVLKQVVNRRKPQSNDSDLNSKFLDKVGLTQQQQAKLIKMNDNKKYSFNKIAKYIQRYL